MTERRACITAVGRYVPERIMTNKDLEALVDTNDEWIRTRTGIQKRHVVEKGTGTSVLAARAAQEALERRGVPASEVDLIIVATVTPDMIFPSTACLVQDRLKATRAWGFDISAACSGFPYALTMGAQFVANGVHKKVLVIGADVMTSILNYQDRATCVLFGDGAGAVLLEPGEDGTGIIDFCHEVDGSGAGYLCMPAGGSLQPATHETVDKKLHYIHQEGPHVFKYAVRKFAETSTRLLERNHIAHRRRRPLRGPPGEHPHHRRRQGAPGPARGEGGEEHPRVRQHHRRHHPPRPRHGPRPEAPEEGRSRAHGRGGGRLHGGLGPAALVGSGLELARAVGAARLLARTRALRARP